MPKSPEKAAAGSEAILSDSTRGSKVSRTHSASATASSVAFGLSIRVPSTPRTRSYAISPRTILSRLAAHTSGFPFPLALMASPPYASVTSDRYTQLLIPLGWPSSTLFWLLLIWLTLCFRCFTQLGIFWPVAYLLPVGFT